MNTLTRVSLASVGLGVGLVLGGCAAPIDDEGALTDETAVTYDEAALTEGVDESAALDPMLLAIAPDEALAAQSEGVAEETDGADADEKVFWGRRGFGWGFGGLPFGGLGFGWAGVPGWGFAPGFVTPGLGWGWGRGLGWGWGTSISCINGICF